MNTEVDFTKPEEQNTSLVTIAKETGLEEERITSLANAFNPLFEEAKQWVAQAKQIKVTSIEQVEEMNQAREARLELKRIRVSVENTRKSMKEDIVRRGKAIDGIANVVKFLIEPVEKHLADQENFIKKIEEDRLNKLEQDRIDELAGYDFDISGLDLRNMPSSAYGIIRDNAKESYTRKIEEERKRQEEIARQEEERKQREAEERARLEEEARIANEKAEEERKAREAEAKKHEEERKKWEAEQEKIRKQEEVRREQERIDKQRKEQEEAARKKKEQEEAAELEAAKKAREEDERKRANAPDREKLLALAVALDNYELPAMKTPEAKKAMDEIITKMSETTSLIRKVANRL